MRDEYDFGEGRRGAVLASGSKTRITIRLDDDVIAWFKRRAHAAGGGSYQRMINDALRAFIAAEESDLESTLRRVIREELGSYDVGESEADRGGT